MESNIWFIPIAVIAYILGSIPIAYYLTKWIAGKDIRLTGSRNIGAMNTFRLIKAEKSTGPAVAGFVLAMAGDIGKGALALAIANWLSFLGYDLAPALIIGSIFAVLGHNYSLFLKFREGGRGIATLGGIIIYLNPFSFIIALGTLLLITILVHYLVAGRINWGKFSEVFSVVGSQIVGRVAGLALAVVAIYFYSPEIFFPVLAGMVLVLIKHIGRVKVYIRELRGSK